ncbi:LPS assembly lipoprotein LptE [Lysobacter sp. S4-A87]|uniref:LPS-assembly lipoprotein LptE n=1 Tax=Lysobacter sp. S4-A87 TaxID=2925843 RepID=UPI001F538024|nr:LPS assembly lipoprotein LptE [Lysobacter sp. S4-A87]UNK49368.1 LPS assembly lipoprotein LptE [Lysobacter sp. S4-A87]
MIRPSIRHSIRRLVPASAALAITLAVSACGFHLRSALVLPPDMGPVRVVSADRYSPLAESLADALTRAGATPATEDTDEATVLDLLGEQWGDRPIALDELGRAQEYSLRYAVTFEVRKPDGSTPVPRQTIELARDYVSNPVQSIGTEGEREILQGEMRREMVASVLRRLDAVARHTVEVPATTPAPTPVTTPVPSAEGTPAPAAAATPTEGGGDTPR